MTTAHEYIRIIILTTTYLKNKILASAALLCRHVSVLFVVKMFDFFFLLHTPAFFKKKCLAIIFLLILVFFLICYNYQ